MHIIPDEPTLVTVSPRLLSPQLPRGAGERELSVVQIFYALSALKSCGECKEADVCRERMECIIVQMMRWGCGRRCGRAYGSEIAIIPDDWRTI